MNAKFLHLAICLMALLGSLPGQNQGSNVTVVVDDEALARAQQTYLTEFQKAVEMDPNLEKDLGRKPSAEVQKRIQAKSDQMKKAYESRSAFAVAQSASFEKRKQDFKPGVKVAESPEFQKNAEETIKRLDAEEIQVKRQLNAMPAKKELLVTPKDIAEDSARKSLERRMEAIREIRLSLREQISLDSKAQGSEADSEKARLEALANLDKLIASLKEDITDSEKAKASSEKYYQVLLNASKQKPSRKSKGKDKDVEMTDEVTELKLTGERLSSLLVPPPPPPPPPPPLPAESSAPSATMPTEPLVWIAEPNVKVELANERLTLIAKDGRLQGTFQLKMPPADNEENLELQPVASDGKFPIRFEVLYRGTVIGEMTLQSGAKAESVTMPRPITLDFRPKPGAQQYGIRSFSRSMRPSQSN